MTKKAIILRGPPDVGKTTLSQEILLRLRSKSRRVEDQPVVLDEGWSPGEFRYTQDNYKDLHARYHDEVVVVELGCAEPLFCWNGIDLLGALPGATRNPGEWVEILRSQGREIFYFLLWADWGFLLERERMRQKLDIRLAKLAYDLFVLADWKAFKERARLTEIILDAQQQQELCERVWTEARLDEE